MTNLREVTKQLQHDVGYQFSVKNNDILNMQMVLRAHGLPYNHEFAKQVIIVEHMATEWATPEEEQAIISLLTQWGQVDQLADREMRE